MALLPSKDLLDGTKIPETTTGEFRVAIGHMRDYLFDLLGENSAEKEEARAALGAVSARDVQRLRHTSAIAAGTADALTAVFEPAVKQLTRATSLTVCAQFQNKTQAPTFKADETSALPIVKGTGQPLEKGDIKGAGHWLDLRYDESINKWILMNPANGIVTNGIACAEAGGTADAITARFNPPVVELKNGLKVSIQALAANTGTEPYVQIENFDAFPIVKGVNLPLIAGDIAGAGHWLDLQYNGKLNKWVLQNPASGVLCPSGVPVGAVSYFAMQTPPPGYLKADGSVVLRAAYPDLFAAIGTVFGEGDGSSTFNLPDLMEKFAQGSVTPGRKIEPGLPNLTGDIMPTSYYSGVVANGAFYGTARHGSTVTRADTAGNVSIIGMDASKSNPVYGASNTVQPPALTLLPCIKAFDAVLNVTEINDEALASDVSIKANHAEIEPCLSQASVNFDASSGIVLIKNARNVQDVVRVEKGVYDVIFDNSMDVNTLTVTASSSALLTSVNRESLTGAYYPPTKDRIRIVTGSGYPPGAEDAADINVIILG